MSVLARVNSQRLGVSSTMKCRSTSRQRGALATAAAFSPSMWSEAASQPELQITS